MTLELPALRERRADIPHFVTEFLAEFRKEMGSGVTEVSEVAMWALTQYRWPGNIRELRNVIERAILVTGERTEIGVSDLSLPISTAARAQPVSQTPFCELRFDHEPTLDEIKETYLSRLLWRHNGHRGRIASILGVSERNTYRLIKRYGLDEKPQTK
jgi:DNA-binding NtrC family response regulator